MAALSGPLRQLEPELFANLFSQLVFNSKRSFAEGNLTAFEEVIQNFSQDFFGASVVPVIVRSLKRSPETFVAAVTDIFTFLRADITPFAVEIARNLLAQVSSSNAALHERALLAWAAFLNHLNDQGVDVILVRTAMLSIRNPCKRPGVSKVP